MRGQKYQWLPCNSCWRNFMSTMGFIQSKSLKDGIVHEKLTGIVHMSCHWIFKILFWIMMPCMLVYPQPSRNLLSGHFSGSFSQMSKLILALAWHETSCYCWLSVDQALLSLFFSLFFVHWLSDLSTHWSLIGLFGQTFAIQYSLSGLLLIAILPYFSK